MSYLLKLWKQSRIYKFLTSKPTIRIRNPKLEVRVIYLNGKQNYFEPKEAPPINLQGYIIAFDQQPTRKISPKGNSLSVTMPSGWLNSIANEKGEVECCFIQTENNKHSALISTPGELRKK